MNRGQQCKNGNCKHLKSDHKEIFQKGKIIDRAECLWDRCECQKFEPGKWLVTPQRYLRDE